MVINSEILEGLRNATDRGESLKDAMMSFFNAGYSKTEIEDAARVLQAERNPALVKQAAKGPTKPLEEKKGWFGKKKEVAAPVQGKVQAVNTAKTSNAVSANPAKTQPVSNYEQEPKKKSKWWIWVLVIVLLLVIAGASAYLFLM